MKRDCPLARFRSRCSDERKPRDTDRGGVAPRSGNNRRESDRTCPGRNFVTLKIETRSGVVGIGDATLNGRELGSMWDW